MAAIVPVDLLRLARPLSELPLSLRRHNCVVAAAVELDQPGREAPDEVERYEEIERKARDALHLVRLEWLEDRYPLQLSGG